MINETARRLIRDSTRAESLASEPDSSFSHLRYSRGYVLHTPGNSPDIPEFWKEQQFVGRVFRWDPRLAMALVASGDNAVLICGLALDPELGSTDVRKIAHRLLGALDTSRQRYLDLLEDLFGQYVVFDQHGAEVRVQSDAIGSRAIFYDEQTEVVASHSSLVGVTLASKPSSYVEWVGNTGINDFPGRTTQYDQVWQLTPNTELSLSSQRVNRIGPRPFAPLSVDEAAGELVPLVQKQVEILLESNRDIVISTSAGVDSRTSLAAFGGVGGQANLQAFTYTTAPSSKSQSRELHRDKLGARMAQDLGIRHTMFDLDTTRRPPNEYVNVLRESSIRRSNSVVSWVYHSLLPHDSIHIRGQINGVGKWHFAQRLHFAESMEISALRMASLTKRGKGTKRPLNDPWWKPGEAGFQEYMDTTQLRSIPTGYRVPDMFLWEHRVANWNHAHIVESDTTFDTYQIFGSRRAIRLLLSVPEIDRVQLTLFRRIIQILSPKLLQYPLNGSSWPASTYDRPLSAYQRGVTRAAARARNLQRDVETANAKLSDSVKEIARLQRELTRTRETVADLREQLEPRNTNGG